jgi:hypothetical protein
VACEPLQTVSEVAFSEVHLQHPANIPPAAENGC